MRSLKAERVRATLEQTFGFRKTHDVPTTLPARPASWAAPYAALAAEDQLEWTALADVLAAARAFLDPALGGGAANMVWIPEQRIWPRR